MELRTGALEALSLPDPAAKVAAVRALQGAVDIALDPDADLRCPSPLPGRPSLPRLVPASALPRRTPFTSAGRAALLHAVAHIEFNAIKIVYNEDRSRSCVLPSAPGINRAG
jgi:uncharacterized ferritin-like protein (DUF455 family)